MPDLLLLGSNSADRWRWAGTLRPGSEVEVAGTGNAEVQALVSVPPRVLAAGGPDGRLAGVLDERVR
jgi:hypothetical protein